MIFKSFLVGIFWSGIASVLTACGALNESQSGGLSTLGGVSYGLAVFTGLVAIGFYLEGAALSVIKTIREN